MNNRKSEKHPVFEVVLSHDITQLLQSLAKSDNIISLMIVLKERCANRF